MGHPHHEIFASDLSESLQQVIPMLLHGDEGRSLKKGKCMVLSLQSALGSTPKPSSRSCCSCHAEVGGRADLPLFGAAGDIPDVYGLTAEAQECLQQQVSNYRGHTYLSRWLLFSLGSWLYTEHPEILQTLLKQVAEDLKDLFYKGISVGRKKWYVAIIGVKGDMDFHRVVYNLKRSYAHVGTTSTGQICHACQAGGGGPIFEDYGESPAWALRCYESRPWDTLPPLAIIPGFPAPEEVLKFDGFHVVKMGVGRSVAGGVLVYLARHGCFDDGDDGSKAFGARLERAHGVFKLWCQAEKKYPSLRSFSKAFLNMKTLASAPWTNTKGADTTMMLQFLVWFVSLQLRSPLASTDASLLRMMLKVAKATLAMFSVIHGHGLWMERTCGRRLYIEIMRVLRGYQALGSKCLGFSYRAFIQKPKNHALHHIAWAIKEQLLTGAGYILNPEVYSAELDEDFIGRVARLSRRVDVRRQGQRVFQRIFLKFRAVRRRRLEGKVAKPPKKRKLLR